MKKLTLLLLILSFIASTIHAQDEAVFSHYTVNPLIINPATSGFDKDHHNLFLNARSQWAGFPGSPKTYLASYNGPVNNSLGIGVLVGSETIADYSRLRAQISPAFKFADDDGKFAFSLGLSLEMHRLRLDSDVMTNPYYEEGDVDIEALFDDKPVFDASFGVYGIVDGRTYIGASLPNMIRNRLDEIAGITSNSDFLTAYTLLVGHKFPGTKTISVEPSILFKKVRNSPILVDFNLLAAFMEGKLISGLTYGAGTGGSLAIMLGTKYKGLQIYYSYDIFFGDFQKYNSGTHEVTLGFQIEQKEGKFDRSKKYRKNRPKR